VPPTTLTIYILLALVRGDVFATDILHQIALDSQSALLPSDSTFYKALKRLVNERLIEVAASGRYHLGNRGRQVLAAESVRIQRLDGLVRQRLGVREADNSAADGEKQNEHQAGKGGHRTI
jgi:DNA-binding PadR family transcriptional regulator